MWVQWARVSILGVLNQRATHPVWLACELTLETTMTTMVQKAYGDVTAAKVRAGLTCDRPDVRTGRSYH